MVAKLNIRSFQQQHQHQSKIVPIFGTKLQRHGTPCRIAATARLNINTMRSSGSGVEVAFTTVHDVNRLGINSVEIGSGTMLSYYSADIMTPLQIISALLNSEYGDYSAREASLVMIDSDMAFSAAQVWKMLTGASMGSRALIRNGKSNMFPVQVAGDEVVMLFAWWDKHRWNVRVSNFGIGRGTDPGVVAHVRNEY